MRLRKLKLAAARAYPQFAHWAAENLVSSAIRRGRNDLSNLAVRRSIRRSSTRLNPRFTDKAASAYPH